MRRWSGSDEATSAILCGHGCSDPRLLGIWERGGEFRFWMEGRRRWRTATEENTGMEEVLFVSLNFCGWSPIVPFNFKTGIHVPSTIKNVYLSSWPVFGVVLADVAGGIHMSACHVSDVGLMGEPM